LRLGRPTPESLPKTSETSRFLSQGICDYTERPRWTAGKTDHQAWEPRNHDAADHQRLHPLVPEAGRVIHLIDLAVARGRRPRAFCAGGKRQ
jgi:hypothetical protein